ncbi:hypothetical protein [Acinetobacter sp.]|uniref:hypothetical protein n=1 Tax=Acinetobacter sp. TaxID=472 RepID=UPI002FC6A6D0
MTEFLDFFSSGPAVAIAWFCTVMSFIYALLQKNMVNKISNKNISLTTNYEKLKVDYHNLEQKIINIESNDIHDNYQEVNQNGKTNINQGVIKGNFNYNA